VSTQLDEAVELLDRALAYTRVALAGVTEHALTRPTPCAGWSLDELLDHMADSLDAFTEAATGRVPLTSAAPPLGDRLAGLQQRACALLGAWTAAPPGRVVVGDAPAPGSLVIATAALEITVHGWDVAQATGHALPVPEALAERLLAVARAVVTEDDRGSRFGPARPARGPSYEQRLLGFLGRS